MEKRSICTGCEFNCGASSCHPEELSSAEALLFAWTERIVTKTCSKLPWGVWQVGGSVKLTLIVPVPLDCVPYEAPPQLTRIAAKTTGKTRIKENRRSFCEWVRGQEDIRHPHSIA